MRKDKNIEVEYACDANLNHKAKASECVTSEKIIFKVPSEELLLIKFVNECSFVYNMNKIKENLAPENASHLKEKTPKLNFNI